MNKSANSKQRLGVGALLLGAILAGGAVLGARGEPSPWMQDVIGASAIESALYRLMDLPGARILYPRPPAESRAELSSLIKKIPDAELYALRAHADEQALDFTAAESDWKACVAHAEDAPAANLRLADFYANRLRPQEEVNTLLLVTAAPSPSTEKFVPAERQRAWKAFERILQVVDDQALPLETKIATYRSWIARYPTESSVSATLTQLLIQQKRFDEALNAIAAYGRAFPQDTAFPVKASALIEYRRGSAENAIALYDKSFQPLWPADLVQSYYSMLGAAHAQRRMLSDAKARLVQNPDDLNSAARVFYYYQQEGRLDAARNAVDEYRLNKDRRKAVWTAEELYTFATLLDRINMYDEAARYYFALYSATGNIPAPRSPQEAALGGVIHILLTAPDQSIGLGSGNLSIYRDIATLDNGPGYFNGILSLWLNSESPRQEFNEEEKRGVPYFHRAKAAELLSILDQKFPAAAARPDLHAEMIRVYADYGDDQAVIAAGNDFLKEFPTTPRRVPVAILMAGGYARTGDSAAEFALYDRMLSELAARSSGMPLTQSAENNSASRAGLEASPQARSNEAENDEGVSHIAAERPAPPALENALDLTATRPTVVTAPDEVTYGQLLDIYLGRLTTMKKMPQALAVLRHELERNPDDPLLYDRLTDFLQQNDFSAQEEEVFRRAIDRFKTRNWYDKLARFYIRLKRKQDFAALTRQVVDTFRGTELEHYFSNVEGGWPQLSLELNIYAHRRFPHDLHFTRNLLTLYLSPETADRVAWGKLIREHWMDAEDLKNQFFDDLSRTGKLNEEIARLQQLATPGTRAEQDPAAIHELAECDLWKSHFEEGAPLLEMLATAYPADAEIGTRASSVYRSLAYFDSSQTARAVTVEKNLLAAEPGNLDRLARIGDIYADQARDDARQLANAAPFWQSMPTIHPGSPDGYLRAATIFWDYFQFDDALAQISAARKQFHDPTLYGYEAGAIYESKPGEIKRGESKGRENNRDLVKAIAEYVSAAIAQNSSARARLVTLATRTAAAELVDTATARALEEHPVLAALSLRADILAAQRHGSAIAGNIDNAVGHSATFDEVDQLATFAEQRHLAPSYEHALRREISLASDPVQRIEIQFALAQSFEAHNDSASAQPLVESVYKNNSKILGVVRTTADFYWNNRQPQRAIATLVQASRDAYPELSRSYTLEAAEKSNASGDYAAARQLVAPLLDADPYGTNSARSLAIIADSFALAKDDGGLRDFYTTRLAALKSAQLSVVERRDHGALLRRGLIQALTRSKDYAGATDQHIALLSAFPEDADVIEEAALYALRYGRQQQLTAFLRKTVTDSPRDARFAIALGRVDTLFEDYSGAIDAYTKAIAIRKDRSDVYIARADLEERLQHFDEACADYERLYFLSYRDAQWMAKEAEARARQGKNGQAVQALQTAWIDGKPINAQNYFNVAGQLEKWSLLDDARGFADQGVKIIGDDLLASPEGRGGAALYARILTRQRHADQALKTLQAVLSAANVSPSSPSVVLEQGQKNGIASVSDEEWRRNRVKKRKQQAQENFNNALQQMGATVATYFTPEETQSYAQLLDTQRASAPLTEVAATWIPAAASAGLRDREAQWRKDVLLSGSNLAPGQISTFNLIEKQRMQNADRGHALEKYATTRPARERDGIFVLAQDAWRDDGNLAAEISVLQKIDLQSDRHPALRERYFELLLQSNPQMLVKQASSAASGYADAAANYTFENAGESLAFGALNARGQFHQPVWRDANTALAGLYYANKSSTIDAAFHGALNDTTIGERLMTRPDLAQHIAGRTWFDYGMRYGVYRNAMHTGDAEEFLASGVEGNPSASGSYVNLAEAYADAKNIDAALREYNHALELAPEAASLHRAIAAVLWSSGRKDEAADHLQQALAILRKLVDKRAVPESFWIDFAAIAQDIHERGQYSLFQQQMDAVLRAYIAKNGEYRSVELLHAAFIASDSPELAMDGILSLANAAGSPDALMALLESESWIPRQQLGRVYQRELELARTSTAPAEGDSGFEADHVSRIRTRLLAYLLDENRDAEAQALYDNIPEKQRQADHIEKQRIILAAHQGRIPQLLAEFTSKPATAPLPKTIAEAAALLRNRGDRQSNRVLLEYFFQVKLEQHGLSNSDFLALALARLDTHDTNDTSGALELLRRMTLFSQDSYGALDSAAHLLETSGHSAEALPFLSTLATSTPWNPGFRLRLALARIRARQDTQPAIADLGAVAANGGAPFAVRVRAASEMKGRGDPQMLASGELKLLASGKLISAEQADQPYFGPSRIAAAAIAPAMQKAAILRKAIAVEPSDAVRLNIFRAEFALGRDDAALAAIQPLLSSPGGYVQRIDRDTAQVSTAADAGAIDETPAEISGAGYDAARYDDARAGVALPSLLASDKERADFTLAIAVLFERTGRAEEAMLYLNAADAWDPKSVASRHAEIARRIAALASRLKIQRENDSRRPLIQESLDQARVVRPRISSAFPLVQP